MVFLLMNKKVKETLEEIKRERQRVWLTEPDEVKKVKGLKGTYDNRYIPLEFARGDLHGCADTLSGLRESLNDDNIDLRSLKSITGFILDFNAGKVIEWYKLDTVERVLRNTKVAVHNVETKEEYRQLIEELLLYVGKVSWWFDIATPWVELNQLYEILVPE